MAIIQKEEKVYPIEMHNYIQRLQKTTIVRAKIYPEPTADIIEWLCPECGQNQKEYTYHIEDRHELQCERCGSTFTRE